MNHEHPVLQEDLMAFGDGQLQGDHARQVAAHVKSCPACAKAVEDAKLLSLQLAAWQVEKAPEEVSRSVQAALGSRPRRHESKAAFVWGMNRQALAYGLGGALFLLVGISSLSLLDRYREMREDNSAKSAGLSATPTVVLPERAERIESFERGQDMRLEKQSEYQAPSDSPTGPLIIRTVQLTLVTKSFEAARARIESIVQESKGYIDQLSIHSEPKSPKGLSAVLRIPDGKLAASLAELRKLGQPKVESQNSVDITGQYVDLVARLSNARKTEQRLLALLRDRTGNLKDVVAAEGEISRVREGIERMEAERKSFDNNVQYATVRVELSEEYRAQLEETLPNTRTRIYNAAVEGYESALDTILGIALTVLYAGPTILVWLAFLFSVGFVAWRLFLFLRSRHRNHYAQIS